MKIDHVYITCGGYDLRYTQCCVASIRRWYREIPITLLKDESDGPFDTRELERAWDVTVFEGEHPLPGGGWATLEPLFLPGRQRCLIIDNDIVFLGRVIDRLEAIDADVIVESKGGRPMPLSRRPDWLTRDYFDLAALEEIDPEFVFPGFTFNAGQFVATSGILERSDFEPLVRFGAKPKKLHEGIFGGVNQGIINYVLTKKAQRGELTLAREPFMEWGFNKLPRRGQQGVRTRRMTPDSPYPYLVHWAGKKHPIFFMTRNAWLLRHFEALYYSRIPGGRRKCVWRSTHMLGRFLKHSAKNRVRHALGSRAAA